MFRPAPNALSPPPPPPRGGPDRMGRLKAQSNRGECLDAAPPLRRPHVPAPTPPMPPPTPRILCAFYLCVVLKGCPLAARCR